MKTYLPTLWPRGFMRDPFEALKREMFGREWPAWFGEWPSAEVGVGVPAMNLAETDGAIEATIELPGVEDKDIKVTLDGDRLIVSGEKKEETKKEEKDWRVVERKFGSFMRAITLPFEPAADAVAARFDKGVLRLEIKKPATMKTAAKTIEVKVEAPKPAETKPAAAPEATPKAA